MSVLAALVGAGAILGSSVIGGMMQKKSNDSNAANTRETNFTNLLIARENNALQQSNFNDLMAYNREKDAFNKDFSLHQYEYSAKSMSNAGINPAVLGSGGLISSSVSSGNMSSGYTPSTPTMQAPYSESLAPSIIGAGSQLSSALISAGVSKSVSRDNNDTAVKVNADNNLSREKIAAMEMENQRSIEAMRIAANKDINAKNISAHAEEIKASAEKMRSETRQNDYDYDYYSSRDSNKSDTGVVKDIKEGINFLKNNIKSLERLENDRQISSFADLAVSKKSDADFIRAVRKRFPRMNSLSDFEILSRRNQVRSRK